MSSPILRLDNIHKAFGPVRALQGVSMDVYPGEVHGLVGENGAGKSTLMKVLSGVHRPDAGRMLLDGKPYAPSRPLDGRAAGISMIYQELALAPHLTVEENITLGAEHARHGWIAPRTDEVRRILADLGQAGIEPDTPVRRLSIGKQQLVEIGRALLLKARVVVMDEPTSSLAASDTRALFEAVARMKRQGVAVIYISHFLEEVQEICDRFTVIRDGEMISTGRVADTSIGGIIEDMVGRAVDELFPSNEHEIGDPILHVAGLKGRGTYPDEVSFTLRRGEILGIAGLVGAGRSETVRALFGLERAEDGRVAIRGRGALRAAYIEPRTALRQGMDLLSEDRKEEGLALNLPMLFNLTLSDLRRYSRLGLLNLRRERADGAHWIRALDIRTDSVEQRADELSGGNQQKLCLARLLQQDNDILFLDEPTRGIDIGSKAEIYRLIHRLAERGKAIVMISSYLPELLGVCDTLGVMFKGRLSTVRPIREWTETSIMRFATSGTWTEAP
jgi:ribose transport system ATP-binding protein